MSDPQRLLFEDGASEFDRALLRSWEAEQPSEAARKAVLAAVGLGAAVAAGAAASKLGAAASGSIAPKAAATAGSFVLAKWLAALAVGVAVAGATAGYLHRGRDRSGVVKTARPAPTANGPAVTATPEAPAPPATTADDLTVQSLPAASAAPRARVRATTPREHPSALGEQVSVLDSARRALAAGDAAGAIRQIDDYEARFPDGALVDEAEVLRVEALVAVGDHATATRVGSRFLANHPNSPHAARVRALIAP